MYVSINNYIIPGINVYCTLARVNVLPDAIQRTKPNPRHNYQLVIRVICLHLF